MCIGINLAQKVAPYLRPCSLLHHAAASISSNGGLMGANSSKVRSGCSLHWNRIIKFGAFNSFNLASTENDFFAIFMTQQNCDQISRKCDSLWKVRGTIPNSKKCGWVYALYPTNDAYAGVHLLTVAVCRYFTLCGIIFVNVTLFWFIYTVDVACSRRYVGDCDSVSRWLSLTKASRELIHSA